ncbi:M15 family metallopeptidase [Demequina sp. NBRC 110056]|uniref:M15 family metallopeptidase n=1 Tax=Demequina sp. NBRC 110056 TaxID=1570345 RepID=UPI00117C13D6|nr:M15 family metallopeptidase [Demequina sp. NBRC 110056]
MTPAPTPPAPTRPSATPRAEPTSPRAPAPGDQEPVASPTAEPATEGEEDPSASAPRPDTATPLPPRTTFLDVSSDPEDAAYSPQGEAIEWLASIGAGLGWGLAEQAARFEPDSPATRADLAAFAYRAAGLPVHVLAAEPPFEDVALEHPALTEISWLASRDAAGDGATFAPDDPASTGDAAVALHALADGPRVVLAPGLSFEEVPARSEFADATEWLVTLGIEVPLPDGAEDEALLAPLSRGELASLLFEAIQAGVVLDVAPSLADALGVPDAPSTLEGQSNGRVADGSLCALSWAPQLRLNCPAAADLETLNAGFEELFSTDIPVSDAYRDLAGQWRAKAAHGRMAATPGTSMHGWGAAIDLDVGGLPGGFSGDAYAWLIANGPAYDWALPGWASPWGAKPEPWHLEHGGTVPADSPAVTTPE